VGVLTLVLLLSAVRSELRIALNAVDSPSLALLIPVLAFAGLVTAITSALTAIVVDMAALVLLVLYMVGNGGDALTLTGVVGLCIMAGLCVGLIRFDRKTGD
jgi:hypothetical protein